jgi:hypothetical protein
VNLGDRFSGNLMKKTALFLVPFFFLFEIVRTVLFTPMSFAEEIFWKRVDEGLHLSVFDPPGRPRMKGLKVTLLKIDPGFYTFKLLCASEHGRMRMTAKKWCEKFKLDAAINAGMYQKDGLTNVGLMRSFNHSNNPRLNGSYKSVLAFNPAVSDAPAIQIIDLSCQDFQSIGPGYHTLIQNIRMVSCRQENVWMPQDRASSMAVFGMDKGGNALMIFTEALYPVHDFINLLLALPISIFNALYLEGGPEASFFFSSGGVSFERVGLYEAGLHEGSEKGVPRPIPNVIGITKKDKLR